MKTRLLFTALLIGLLTTGFSRLPASPQTLRHCPAPASSDSIDQNRQPVGIRIVIEFGRRKFGCKRFGICRIYLEGTEDDLLMTTSLGDRSSEGQVTVENGKISIQFNALSMTTATFGDFFGGDTFIVEEDFALPKEVLSLVKMNTYTIKAGLYQIRKLDNGNVSVSF